MSQTTSAASQQPLEGFFKPAGAWYAILGLAIVTLLLTLGHAGSIVRIGFPLAAFGVGVYLYRTVPVLYVGFTWWIWFLSPWIRRMVDYFSTWVDPSPILLTPPLVTLIMGATLIKKLPTITKEGGVPFILAIAAILYSYAVGIIQAPIVPATIAAVSWLPPILFAFHILTNWQDYPKYRANTQQVFLWATLIMGVYGIVQFLIVPGWDKFWMDMSEMNSIGTPEPLQIRVFSVMNAPGAFAVTMMAGLLLLLANPSAVGFAASGAGYLSFLISSVRSSWLGWAVGLAFLFGTLKSNLQMRLFLVILLMGLSIMPLTMMEPFASNISKRMDTFSNVKEDISFQERSRGYDLVLDLALSQGLGAGLGAADSKTNRFSHVLFPIGVNDSTVLSLMYTLGWMGAVPYLVGFGLILINTFRAKVVKSDPFASCARAIVIGCVAQFWLGSIFLGISGILTWVFASMVIAAQRHHNLLRHSNHEPNYDLNSKKS
jgi:hypothetical protein